MKALHFFVIVFLLIFSVHGCGPFSSCFLDGVVNTYRTGSKSIDAGTKLIYTDGSLRGESDNLVYGSRVFIIQMQDATIDYSNTTNYGRVVDTNDSGVSDILKSGNAGVYEYALVQEYFSNGTIELQNPLQNSYYFEPESTKHGRKSFQIVTVKMCTQAYLIGNLTCESWNGENGGILLLDVGQGLDFQGNAIDCSGKGFRGAVALEFRDSSQPILYDYVSDYDFIQSTDRVLSGYDGNELKGEGIAGTPLITIDGNGIQYNASSQGYPGGDFARGPPANGGGGANEHNSGAGGGSLGGAGGKGGNSVQGGLVQGIGGYKIDVEWPKRIMMGGGGGAGHINQGDLGSISHGAPGGGIVIVRTSIILGDAKIISSGQTGYSAIHDGAGGGGGGGFIALLSDFSIVVDGEIQLIANGGNGGTSSNLYESGINTPHGSGGGGGGGVIVHSEIYSLGESFFVDGGLAVSPPSPITDLPGEPGDEGVVKEINYEEYFSQVPPLSLDSCSKTLSLTPSITPTLSNSTSMSNTVTKSKSISNSMSPSRTVSKSFSISVSGTITKSTSPSISLTKSQSSSKTKSTSSTISKSKTSSITNSNSGSITISSTSSISTSISISPSTLYYIIGTDVESSSSTPVPRESMTEEISNTPSLTQTPVFLTDTTSGGATISLGGSDSDTDIVILDPSEDAVNELQSLNGISGIINIELIRGGVVVQPTDPVKICFDVDSNDDACLSFFNEEKQEWECEDECLEYENGQACGETSHFTNFAVILTGGSGGGDPCNTSEDWIFDEGWQDSILIGSVVGLSCFCVICIILVGVLFPRVHGGEYSRSLVTKKSIVVQNIGD